MQDRDLYRGRRLDNGEWAQGYVAYDTNTRKEAYIVVWFGGYSTCCSDCGSSAMEFYEVDPSTVGQCTGLRDKSGTMIFEGDIVRITVYNDSFINTVIWYSHGWNLRGKAGLVEPLFRYGGDNLEVIGTIHTTPELMEGNDGTD